MKNDKKIRVSVTALSSAEKNASLFVSAGRHCADFQQNTPVYLSKKLINVLKNSTMKSYREVRPGVMEAVEVPAYAINYLD